MIEARLFFQDLFVDIDACSPNVSRLTLEGWLDMLMCLVPHGTLFDRDWTCTYVHYDRTSIELSYIIVYICIGVSIQLPVHHLFRKMKQITVKMITLK